MKGLMIKDMFSLRKQMRFFIFVVVSVFVISIMFVLSVKFGNVGRFLEKIQTDENAVSEEITIGLTKLVMLFCLFIPIAFTGNVTEIFLDDYNASFEKLMSAFPISVRKRVAARYISGISFTLTGLCISLILSLVLSLLTTIINFDEYMRYLICFTGVILIYLSILIVLAYIIGGEKTGLVGTLPVIIMVLTGILIKYKTFYKMLFLNGDILLIFFQAAEKIQHMSVTIFVISLLCLILSYILSVFVTERKAFW